MQKELLTRCGYRCDLCLAYKYNIENNDQRAFLSDTWYKIYGFRIPPEEINCEGCISSNTRDVILIDKECPVRPCVIEKGLENCSQCEDYPCNIFNQRKVVYETYAKVKEVSRREYSHCIKPYENKKRLDEIRSNNFPFSRLLNSEITPDDDGILRYIADKKVKDTFTDLLSFLKKSYKLDRKIMFGGKKYGWLIQYKKSKKTIVTIFPERRSFTVLLIFGKSELEEISDNKKIFSRQIFEKIKNTKQYHDGKWMWLRMENDNYINDIKELIRLKRRPDKE